MSRSRFGGRLLSAYRTRRSQYLSSQTKDPKVRAKPARALKAPTREKAATTKVATAKTPAVKTKAAKPKAPAKAKPAKPEEASVKKTAPKKAALKKATPKKPVAAEISKTAAMLALVLKSLDEDKAEDVVSINLAGKTPIADYMVVASGRSQRHVSAVADHLVRRLKETGFGAAHVEGMRQGDWVLIDSGDVVIHVFRPEVREFYRLEKMWLADIPADQIAV